MNLLRQKNIGLALWVPYCMSPILGEDANDLHVRAGLVPVVELLMNVRLGGAHG